MEKDDEQALRIAAKTNDWFSMRGCIPDPSTQTWQITFARRLRAEWMVQQEPSHYDYTRTFNAIAKAVKIEGDALAISCATFWREYGAAHVAKPTTEKPLLMALCEINRIVLHPGQLYKFEAVVGCKKCEQYGKEPAAHPVTRFSGTLIEAHVLGERQTPAAQDCVSVPMEAKCPRCRRLYYLEPSNDPGVCCICHRDDEMEATYGADWRAKVLAASKEPK